MPTANSQQPTANSAEISSIQQSFLNALDERLWTAADKLRSSLDAANYKHIVLGIIFLKYVSDTFQAQQRKIRQELTDPQSEFYFPDISEEEILAELEIRDYYTKDNVFYVPQNARWDELKKYTKANIGDTIFGDQKFRGVINLIDSAFEAIERENAKLKGVITRISSFDIEDSRLAELIDLFSDTHFTQPSYNGKAIELGAKDILGHVYEYFLGQFALAEGKKGGQYFTPKSIVTLIVEMLEPYQGRIYDPAMGSGGFFVQTDRFIEAHQDKRSFKNGVKNISIYGQESNPTTYRLAAMNMAIRGIEFDFAKGDTLQEPQHIDHKMDFVMANPPFNQDQWWNASLAHDPRWQYGTPPSSNANFAWLQHMLYHLSPKGKMALLLANGSMSSQTNGEGDIRRKIVRADLVEAMIALPSQLFTNTQIPACIWVLNKAKARKGEVLFIDARQIGYMKTRVLRDFTPKDIAHIADTYHQWQNGEGYTDQPAFCKSATLAEIESHDFVLTPGRYVGTPEQEDDGVPFAEKMQHLTALLREQFQQSAELEQKIKQNLEGLGYE